MQHYGDAALIFATHDGYPQIVNGLLYNQELGAIFTGEMLGIDWGYPPVMTNSLLLKITHW